VGHLRATIGVRILFVENHRLFAETVIEQFLSGHEVVIATNVAEAKEMTSKAFDVALVDYDLPDGKGTAVVRALKANGFRGTIIAVSSKEEGNAELRAAGAKVTCAKKDFRRLTELLAKV